MNLSSVNSDQAAALFTAAQIAKAAGISQRAVYKQIGTLRPSGDVIHGGKLVSAWKVSRLPPGIQAKLNSVALKRGYGGVGGLLAAPPSIWQPEQPLSAYGQDQIDRASRLRKAMARTLSELNDPAISHDEVVKRGLADFSREFGYQISARHWTRLFMRTLRRDAGAENWMRLEIYLDERPVAAPAGPSAPGIPDPHADIRAYIGECRLRGMKESDLKAAVWVKVFDHCECEIESGLEESAVRQAALEFMEKEAAFVARSPKALREQFRVKWMRWQSSGGKPSAILDSRRERSGNFRAVRITEADKAVLVARAVQYGPGGLSMAFRECLGAGKLSPAVTAYYQVNWNQKSYVPKVIREQLRNDIEIVRPWVHGPHAGKMRGAYTERDPETFHSGDWFQADDLTAPVCYYDEENPFTVIRGQTLIMVDCRSLCVLGFVVIPLPQYTSFDIRNLVSAVYDDFGLPRKGFYFEKGLWKESRLVTGRKDDVQWGETELGLREFVKFRHAQEARGKVVERILGLIQNHMGTERGYAGRDERNQGFERIKDQIQAVRSMKYHASEYFLSKTEWVDKFRGIVDVYNGEIQNGKYLPGISPLAGFEKFFGNIPLTRLPDSCRFILANHKIPVTVGRNGISFTLASRRWTYKSGETGALYGQTVKVWFNPESPEIVSVTDLDNHYLCTVPLAPMIPAMDATPEQMAAAERANNAHNAYGKRVFETIRPNLFSEQFRRRMFKPSIVDSNTRILGAQMGERREAVAEEVKKNESMRRKNTRLANKLNMPTALTPSQMSQEAMAEALKGKERLISLFTSGDDAGGESHVSKEIVHHE